MQNEEEQFVQIFKESKKKLIVLKLLSNFFNHPDFVSVLIRTKIIHNLFEKNKMLDANKLDLFHIQYTNTLIELFQKLKKAKEQQYVITLDEIYINNDFISKLDSEVTDEKFPERIKRYSQEMSQKTEELYKMLVTDNTSAVNWNSIISFANEFKSEYYREISLEKYEELVCVERSIYMNQFVKFEKKLLGRLNILKFKVKFLCGLICKNEVLEVFEFRDSNDKFIFNPNDRSFYFLNEEESKDMDLSKNCSDKGRIGSELIAKNLLLNEKLETIKTSLPDNVKNVLKEYLEKISSVDFLDELQNVDEQTNVLKAMLNININSK